MTINMRILLPEGCYHYDVVVNIVKMPILQIPEDVVNMKIICTGFNERKSEPAQKVLHIMNTNAMHK